MKISDEVMREYRKRSATLDIPKPITIGYTEMSEEKKKKAIENLKKLIEESKRKKASG